MYKSTSHVYVDQNEAVLPDNLNTGALLVPERKKQTTQSLSEENLFSN